MNVTRRNFLKLSAGTAVAAATPAAYAKAAEQTKIPKRKFGRHDDMLTVLGVGGHTLYLSGSQKEADEIVARAYDLGVNFYETSWDYHGGQAEEYMGNALVGKRDKIFLMTKFCNFHSNSSAATVRNAMEHLEDSLRRLKTDYLDLWMMHNVSGNDAEDAYKKDGAIEAMELAKKQGKIRYTGFTGHTAPSVHNELINRGYQWDATLMPVSIVGAVESRQFEAETIPLCEKNNIAILGMKGFGGSRRTHLHSRATVQEVLQYSLSYPQVCTHVVGMDKLEYLDQAVAGTAAQPWSPEQRVMMAKSKVDLSPGSPDFAAMQHGGPYYEQGCSYATPDQHS